MMKFISLLSRKYTEMCLLVSLRFSLQKLMTQSKSTTLKGKLGEDQMSSMHKSVSQVYRFTVI